MIDALEAPSSPILDDFEFSVTSNILILLIKIDAVTLASAG